jgi:hypothetical protein
VQVSIEQDPRFPSSTRSQVKIAHRRSVSLKIVVLPEARYGHHSASAAILQAAHDLHLSQPIVTGVTRGYRRLIARFLGIEDATPVTVEVIDSRDKLEALARKVRCMLPAAMISWEAIEQWVPLEVIE